MFESRKVFMRLTTKGRFAVTAMIDLAMRQAEGPVTLSGISKRQKNFFVLFGTALWQASASANCG